MGGQYKGIPMGIGGDFAALIVDDGTTCWSCCRSGRRVHRFGSLCVNTDRIIVKFAKIFVLLACAPILQCGAYRVSEMSDTEVKKIKVWDAPVRLFHWSLVIGFVLAYLSAEKHLMDIHVLIGYFLCSLLVFRLLWGFIGTQYARFRSFVFSPAETLGYVRSLRSGHPIHYYGHNPAGALMVFALLGLLALIFASGLVTLAVIDYEGPLLFLANQMGDDTAYLFRHLHDWLVKIALLLIPLHLLGVLQGSIQHKENLVRAMVTGWKQVHPSSSGH